MGRTQPRDGEPDADPADRLLDNGTNIPGKPVEVLNYGGGLPLYATKFAESADRGYAGFELNRGA